MSSNQVVDVLLEKSAKADKSDDAMRFSQAACNAANALITMSNIVGASRVTGK